MLASANSNLNWREKKLRVAELVNLTRKRRAREKMAEKVKGFFGSTGFKTIAIITFILVYFFIGGMTLTYLGKDDVNGHGQSTTAQWHSYVGAAIWPIALPSSIGARLLEDESKRDESKK